MEEKDNKSFWAIITAPVLYSKELSDKSKILYGVISNLTKQKGYCYAHNSTLAEELGWGERTVQDCIKQLEDAGFISRVNEFIEKNISVRKIFLVPQQYTACPPGSTLHGSPAVACTHNEVTNKVIKKTAAPRKKQIDPQHAQAAAEHELDSLFRWERLIKIWRTEEDSTFQRRAAKKHFWPMDGNVQEEIVIFVESLGTDVKLLQKSWIGPMLKDGLLTVENIKKEVEKRKGFNKTGSGIKQPGFFGEE